MITEQQKDNIREEFFKDNIPDYQDGCILMKDIADWWLQKIDELLKSQREETMKQIESGLENYFLSSYPIPDSKVIIGYLRESLIKEEKGRI